MNNVRITFGIIVFNGEPFTRYLLRALYPFAHQIIVVEGVCVSASSISTSNGHSTDGTLEVLMAYKAHHDPEGKLFIVTAKDEGYSNGFWPEKDQMSQAYAKRVTGNYLWQVDSDEFYRQDDMKRIIDLLRSGVDAISFPTINFFGGLNYAIEGFYLIRDRADEFHRIFAWGKGYVYKTHRPPTVVDEKNINLRNKFWLSSEQMRAKSIYLYHYSLLFPKQVGEKVCYYSRISIDKIKQHGGYNLEINDWYEKVFKRIQRPFHVHNIYKNLSWLYRFKGRNPEQIEKMMNDIRSRNISINLRDNQDIERLLSNPFYVMFCAILKLFALFLKTSIGQLFFKFSQRCANVFTFKYAKDKITGFKIYKLKGLERIGSDYGGYVVPGGYLNNNSVCYCAGVGEDVSFDLGIIEKYHCLVFAFDPTPRAKLFVEKNTANHPLFKFFNFGVWREDGRVRFFAPKDPAHVSYSIVNLQKTQDFIEVDVKRFRNIMDLLGHSKINLLKLDVEGAEYEILNSLIDDNINIDLICVEYDEFNHCLDHNFTDRIKESLSNLIAFGYTIIYSDSKGRYTLVKGGLL